MKIVETKIIHIIYLMKNVNNFIKKLTLLYLDGILKKDKANLLVL